MKIITKEEFLSLPGGTVYMLPFPEESAVGLQPGIYIKGETCFGDWYTTPTDNWVWDDENIADLPETFDSAHEKDVPMDYETQVRHDDPRIRFVAVLSAEDVRRLCDALGGVRR